MIILWVKRVDLRLDLVEIKVIRETHGVSCLGKVRCSWVCDWVCYSFTKHNNIILERLVHLTSQSPQELSRPTRRATVANDAHLSPSKRWIAKIFKSVFLHTNFISFFSPRAPTLAREDATACTCRAPYDSISSTQIFSSFASVLLCPSPALNWRS